MTLKIFPFLLILHYVIANLTTNSEIKENKTSDSKVQLVLDELQEDNNKGGLIESEGILDHLDYFEIDQEATTGDKAPQTNIMRRRRICLFPWNC
ncbi:hypothetical protein Mgra_00005088 [Meloidogyne graminicola]|uniref:Uncharacterized protein n=1 Tax=Meloidogyne graminicola TaxID=189291 RepID=A0A8S9ZR65_9BILA|nr:hypothetical protein Mgra_00005088 [Meloidogyne graminicola]